ncbi:ribbon-helix-helix domain-containing protein [Sphaerothrix gracilis]|uniref:ribbon-helix-helix domain-containing protein n=1 Tax=Sphaerothrix gracilis TaxID=3151835 RepID=UPI0031FC3813
MAQAFVSKRYFVTLPDGIAAALDKWAESENNKPTTLAAFLIEKAVREAADKAIIPPISQIESKSESS